MPISVSLQGPPASPIERFFRENSSQTKHPPESAFLTSIRTALRGSGGDRISVHSSIVPSFDGLKEVEIGWNHHTIILSEGGVITKKWSFEEEGQAIQWACVGLLEHASCTNLSSSHNTPHTSDLEEFPLPSTDPKPKSTFGPFTQAEQQKTINEDEYSSVPALFVFLRSI